MNTFLTLTIAFCSISKTCAKSEILYGTACADADGAILGKVSTSSEDTGVEVTNLVGIELIDLCESEYGKEKVCQIGKEIIYPDGSHGFIPHTIANAIKKEKNNADFENFDLNSRAAFERLRKIEGLGESQKSKESKKDDGNGGASLKLTGMLLATIFLFTIAQI